jgi:hypothetical protein
VAVQVPFLGDALAGLLRPTCRGLTLVLQRLETPVRELAAFRGDHVDQLAKLGFAGSLTFTVNMTIVKAGSIG